ncbi:MULTISPECIES: hypothetical protein [unclassified Curtobacterium]|uniref:hypothetical protein n=1 Tax=unclassified Curtobacterium TaxID=257496 RepID=UPI000FA3AD89|nr:MULTISPECIES: hypothetical protein [unclassified Curtobacterium]ROQ05089.1 hypothetical protein EDF41_3213 [Curtobacterium sp. PhB171]ROQ22290.1 hypothetical protein EDF40_3381 [Curtobacterium sp. PhB170]ROS33650.1 hypothetical protein EDF25_3036 [Curtobacterium sp. PhB131]ROS64969.1 hypothetical protein EDF30_3390 [Curtobacterium sp. PhB141]
MEHRSRTVLRAARDAVPVVAGSVAIGLVIVIAGLGWLDDMAYIAVAVAAVAVCGFGALVGLAVIRASVGSSDGARRAGSRRSAPDR